MTKKRHLNPLIVDWLNLFVYGLGAGLGFTLALFIIFYIVTVIL